MILAYICSIFSQKVQLRFGAHVLGLKILKDLHSRYMESTRLSDDRITQMMVGSSTISLATLLRLAAIINSLSNAHFRIVGRAA